ncbi:MAG TPA: hypothetical protein VK466_11745 [Terriglobales bacterium]|nr:hypothetical protein [Terriglobales bacterium]
MLLRIGLIAGTLDIADALIFSHFRGVSPSQVFHYIASGLLGVRAFEMGTSAYALGVLIHYTIALSWTVVYYALWRRFEVIRRTPVLSGLLYGSAVYVIMNFVVLPVSGVPKIGHVTLAARINGVLALMLCIGLTVSVLLHRNLQRS